MRIQTELFKRVARRKLYACGYSEYACEYSEYPCGYPEYACSGNVICLDVLRAIKREPASAAGEYSEYPAVSTRSTRL